MAIVRRIVWERIFELMFFVVIYEVKYEFALLVCLVCGGDAGDLCDKSFQIYLKTVSSFTTCFKNHQQCPPLTTNPSAVSSNAHHPKCGS